VAAAPSPLLAPSSEILAGRGVREAQSGVAARVLTAGMASTGASVCLVSRSARETQLTLTADEVEEHVLRTRGRVVGGAGRCGARVRRGFDTPETTGLKGDAVWSRAHLNCTDDGRLPTLRCEPVDW